jgi:hydrogenase large subunit
MSKIITGPFNRVEGDLEVSLDIENSKVISSEVNSPLFRGFEFMAKGRAPLDILVFAPRICGICSVSQSVAAAGALAQVYGVKPTPNGQKSTNIMLANENAADLLTHFYMFFMPDFAREIYQSKSWFAEVNQRFKAVEGSSSKKALQARAEWMKIMGVLAGRWPHTLAIQPGGSSRSVSDSETVSMLLHTQQMRIFLEEHMLKDNLESFLANQDEDSFENWLKNPTVATGDLAIFVQVAKDLNLAELGKIDMPLMSYGNYPKDDDSREFPSGLFKDDHIEHLNTMLITEDISHAHYNGNEQLSPWSEQQVQPQVDKKGAYSWCKAPRLDNQAVEVGALARQRINKQPLVTDLHSRYGSNVYTRIMARLVELATIVTLSEKWLKDGFDTGAPYCNVANTISKNNGMGLVEAARGSLGHWVEIDGDFIQNFQVIAPTTWNFSPKDQNGRTGALETALIGAPVQDGEIDPISVQHIVRSFDPCMVCTVH